LAKFRSGYNCAQAVLYAFCDALDFDREAALKLACGLGAGLGRRQEVCGAVTGGILALGLRHGRGEGGDRTPTEVTYAKVRDLMARFESRHGSCVCRVLLKGCDLSSGEGQRHYKENHLLETTCAGCVATAVEAVEAAL